MVTKKKSKGKQEESKDRVEISEQERGTQELTAEALREILGGRAIDDINNGAVEDLRGTVRR